VVADGRSLHGAKVGDSRLHLCRSASLQSLTRNHLLASVVFWLGKLTPEAASRPDAAMVMQALAGQPAIQPGQGIHPDTTKQRESDGFGSACLALNIGVSIQTCPDGPETDVHLTVNR